MPADAQTGLFTRQANDSNFDEDLPAYPVADYDDEPDEPDRNDQNLLTIQELVASQQEDALCWFLIKEADALDRPFLHDKFDVLSKRAKLTVATQKFVLSSIRKEEFRYEHYSTMFDHSGARHISDRMRRSYYWPHIANVVYSYVENASHVEYIVSTGIINISYNYFYQREH